MRNQKGTIYRGSLIDIRDLEDSIRISKKYTKVLFNKKGTEIKIQGDDFPSRTLTEHYEVYPDLVISMDMKATDMWKWVWGDLVCIRVDFTYHYNDNKGRVVIHGKNGVVQSLAKGIEGFSKALTKVDHDERS